MSHPQPRVRKRVTYTGRVQGVGFRYTAVSIARRYPVAGYVKNLADGDVELVAEGDAGTVQAFLDQIADAFRGNITDVTIDDAGTGEAFDGFELRY